MRSFGVLAVIATLAWACAPSGDQEHGRDWAAYGSDKANTKYAPLSLIHADNVSELRLAWRWTSPDEEILASNPGLRTWIHEATPLAIDGVLYTATSLSQIVAIDAGSGETLWVYDPGTWKRGSPPNMGFVHRGLAHWSGTSGGRLFAGTGDGFLLALELATGQPAAGFGEAGRVDLTQGLRRPVDRDLYGVTSPPVICRDVVIVGSSISDDPLRGDMPPGDVRGFDRSPARLAGSFRPFPRTVRPAPPGRATAGAGPEMPTSGP